MKAMVFPSGETAALPILPNFQRTSGVNTPLEISSAVSSVLGVMGSVIVSCLLSTQAESKADIAIIAR